MKKMMITMLAALMATTLFAENGGAPKGVTLRLDLPVGEKTQMEAKMKMNFFSDEKLSEKMISMDVSASSEYTVTSKTDGIHTIEYVVTRLKLDQEMMGMQISYDSDNPEAGGPMAQQVASQMGGVLNEKITFKVNARGEVVEEPEMTADGMVIMSQFSRQLFVEFPEEEITQGQTWTKEVDQEANGQKVTMKMDFTAEEVTSKQVKLKMKIVPSSFKMEGEGTENVEMNMSGDATFDLKTGKMLLTRNNTTSKIPNPQTGGEMFMVMTSQTSTL